LHADTISQSSEAPAVEETKNSAIDNAKSFIAGGFGGVSAVLVGEKVCVVHTTGLTFIRFQDIPLI
jgi:hypothetical protein